MSKKVLLLILVAILLMVVGICIYQFMFFSSRKTTSKERFGNADCQPNPNPLFISDIADISKIKHITPPITIQQTGVKTHGYIFTNGRIPLYAPVNSAFVEGSFYEEEGIGQYLLMFQASCEVFYLFDHIGEPVEGIKANLPTIPANDSRTKKIENLVHFKAGDLIGYTSGPRFGADFGVYNTTKQNPYSDLDLDYKDSLRNAHAVCPFEYFPQDKKQVYYNLLRNVDGGTLTNPHSLCSQ